MGPTSLVAEQTLKMLCSMLNMLSCVGLVLLQVCPHSVSWLLDMAAYLEVQPLQDACCDVRQNSDTTAASLLLYKCMPCSRSCSCATTCRVGEQNSTWQLQQGCSVGLQLPQSSPPLPLLACCKCKPPRVLIQARISNGQLALCCITKNAAIFI